MTADAGFKPEITRYDLPQIIAKAMSRVVTMPVRLAYDSGGYKAGQAVARNSTSTLYQKYDDSASSGLNTAVAVLAEDIDAAESSGGGQGRLAVVITHGELYATKVVGVDGSTELDANGRTDLKASIVYEADGTRIFSF